MNRGIKETLRGPYGIIIAMLLAEYVLLMLSGVTPSGLHGDIFFSLGVDPLAWLFRLSGIPEMILGSRVISVAFDLGILVLLVLLFRDPSKRSVAVPLFVLLLSAYLILVSCLTHRNFQAGFFWVVFPFMFRGEARALAFEALRYFLLLFYFSAGLYKIFHGAFWDAGLFSGHLSGQFAPYFLEGNTGWRTDLNLFLVNHLGAAHLMYGFGILAELVMVIGFFTRRFDKWLGFSLLLFHGFNWVIMDIGVVGQVAFISILFIRKENYK